MSEKIIPEIAVVGIDIGKNAYHVIGLDRRGAVVLRQRWSRSQVEIRFANMPPCLIGMEACVGALSHCQIEHATNLLARQAHAAATTSCHVFMAAALKARCVLAEVR
jgi:hypothetical protein